MGFGYVFVGYLVTFILSMTAGKLDFRGIALLLGYALMMRGLIELNHYHHAFRFANWTLIPLILTAVYDAVRSFSELFAWNVSFVTETVTAVVQWVIFGLMILFNLLLLYGIRMIAQDVGLPSLSAKAVRNMIPVLFYALLYLTGNALFAGNASVKKYLAVAVVITNILWVVLNVILLLNCDKDICPANDVEQKPRNSRFRLINKLNDAYNKNRDRAIAQAKQEAEEKMRLRREKREKKKIDHHKK